MSSGGNYLGPLPGMLWCSVRGRYFSNRGVSSTNSSSGGLCPICDDRSCENSTTIDNHNESDNVVTVDNFQNGPLTPATVGSHPADPRIIASLIPVTPAELRSRESENYRDCAICLQEFEIQSEEEEIQIDAVRLPNSSCTHVFHRDCITRWLRTRGHCPQCRAPADEALLVAAEAARERTPRREGASSSSKKGSSKNTQKGSSKASNFKGRRKF